jgi:hypothetical protein
MGRWMAVSDKPAGRGGQGRTAASNSLGMIMERVAIPDLDQGVAPDFPKEFRP